MKADFEKYFGDSDASQTARDEAASVHAPREFETAGLLKSHDKTTGRCIVVGIKGSGKTALRKQLESDAEALIWNVDADHSHLSLDPEVVERASSSGLIKGAIAFHLLQAFVEKVSEDKAQSGFKKVVGGLKKAGAVGVDLLKKIPSAVKVGAAGVELDVERLFATKNVGFVQSAWQATCDEVIKALDGRRAYIMIDDAEDVFLGMEKNPAYVEGVARAVADINLRTGATLHVFLFLKYGIWRFWYENPGEYDKTKSHIQHIAWPSTRELAALIARRIAKRASVKFQEDEVEKLWRRDFDWSGEFDVFFDGFACYCSSGPRDLIELLNNSKLSARDKRITQKNILDGLERFSEDKLFGLNADYKGVYPDLTVAVEALFRDAPRRRSGKELLEAIDTKIIMDDKVHAALGGHRWFSQASKERLLKIMYEVGVLGRVVPGGVVYSIQSPQEPASNLRESKFVVHPAFRPYLDIALPSADEARADKRSSVS